MDIYLIRHADAVPAGPGGPDDDANRPLSEAGKAQSQALALALQQQGIRIDAVLTSPLLRARQTGEEMLRHWNGPAPLVQALEDLNMDGKTKRIARALRELGKEAVALIGHQPDLCSLAAWLIGSKKAQLDLAKAGAALIQCRDGPGKGSGVLLWLVTPPWMQRDKRS